MLLIDKRPEFAATYWHTPAMPVARYLARATGVVPPPDTLRALLRRLSQWMKAAHRSQRCNNSYGALAGRPQHDAWSVSERRMCEVSARRRPPSEAIVADTLHSSVSLAAGSLP